MIVIPPIAKILTSLAISQGTGCIVSSIASRVVENPKPLAKACVKIASIAIGGYVGSKASDHFIGSIDEIVAKINNKMNKEENANGSSQQQQCNEEQLSLNIEPDEPASAVGSVISID